MVSDQAPATLAPQPDIRPVISAWPRFEADEIAAVTRILKSGRVNSLVHGDECRAFEAEFAEYVGLPYAISVSNGTVSLELALRAFGIGQGDEVILPARSFFASASSIAAVGARPVFADILPDSQNIDPASAARLLTPCTRAILCVHLAGWPCEMDALQALCDGHGLRLIEDCAQAHGATYRGAPVGSFGDAASFSFCTDKIMSTGGEGGMLLLAQKANWARAWAYKDHGKNPQKVFGSSPSQPGEFRYCHDGFGSNFRMTEMQAAIGRRQLGKLPEWIEKRRGNVAVLERALPVHPALEVIRPPETVGHAYYKYYLQLKTDELPQGMKRSDMVAGLQALGISCGSGSCPDMSQEGAFTVSPPQCDGDLANARALGERTIMFPVDHLMEDADMQAIGAAISHILT